MFLQQNDLFRLQPFHVFVFIEYSRVRIYQITLNFNHQVSPHCSYSFTGVLDFFDTNTQSNIILYSKCYVLKYKFRSRQEVTYIINPVYLKCKLCNT